MFIIAALSLSFLVIIVSFNLSFFSLSSILIINDLSLFSSINGLSLSLLLSMVYQFYHYQIPATDMRLMRWDENLAVSAQAHASECTFSHSTNRNNVVGENIWASVFDTYRDAVQIWFNEVYDKNCDCTNYYKHCCGHYTQVWEN